MNSIFLEDTDLYSSNLDNQIKTKIFIYKSIDAIFIIALAITAIYTALYSENKEFMIASCLAGLFLVNTLGKITNKRIAIMGVQLEALKREHKKEEQRTIMRTRHTTIRKTSTTTINTDTRTGTGTGTDR
ncbi:MAG TPA: hypothetical protein EYQ42_08755 [Thiotrichaceae bacterium]|nr:hypothetical protein [Thiotrichaceae bacterium]